MSIWKYLRGQARLIAFYVVLTGILSLLLVLETPTGYPDQALLYMHLVGLVLLFVYLWMDWVRWDRYLRSLRTIVESAAGGLVPALPKPGNMEQEALDTLLRTIQDKHAAQVASLRRDRRESIDFLGSWVHEIRTPIAISRLVLESSSQSDGLADSVSEELDRIEALVEQILYYTKADELSRDYRIGELSPGELIRDVIRKHRKAFIAKDIRANVADDESLVDSDRKWLFFILDQLVTNALKYTPKGGQVTASVRAVDGGVIAEVSDTGCGIPPEDVPRIFDIGFTGANGRANLGASGMGLYLAGLLAKRLGHVMTVESAVGEGTTIAVAFPEHHDYIKGAWPFHTE